MITMKIQVDTNDNALLLSQLLGNIKFINTVEIFEISDKLQKFPSEKSFPKKQKMNPSKFYGIWKDKNIKDIKKFRELLWERK